MAIELERTHLSEAFCDQLRADTQADRVMLKRSCVLMHGLSHGLHIAVEPEAFRISGTICREGNGTRAS